MEKEPGLYCDPIILLQRSAGRGRRREKNGVPGEKTRERFHTLAGNQTPDFSVGAKHGEASTERVE